LKLAGKTDIHRFFVTYAELKRQFQFGDVTPAQWRSGIKMVYRKSEPYSSQIVDGLNGQSSLYEKRLNTSVDPASVEKIQRAYRDYTEERYLSKIDRTLNLILRDAVDRKLGPRPDANDANLKDRKRQIDLSKAILPMKSTVRKQVADLMLKSTRPPEFYGNSRNYVNIVVVKMLEVDEKLAKILTPQELERVRTLGRSRAKNIHLRNRQLRRIQIQVQP